MCTICQQSAALSASDTCILRSPIEDVAIVVNNDDQSPDSIQTSNYMEVGDTFYGELDYAGDWDWVAIDLEQGQSIQVNLDGFGSNAVEDTVLFIADAIGNLVAENDDFDFPSLYSQLEFTASEAGTYFVIADSYNQSFAGDYSLSVEETVIVIPDFDVEDTISWGSSVSSNDINVYFASSNYGYDDGFDTYISEAWTNYERQQFEAAFDLIEASVDVNFQVVNSAANADFTLVMEADPVDFLGFFNPPGTADEGIGVYAGDNWDRNSGGDLELGGYGFVTIVHELLHGLGLAHPHDDGGSSTVMAGVTGPFGSLGAYDLNQGIYTTMSYNSGLIVGDIGSEGDNFDGLWGFEAGPMALDIAVLQGLYGANTNNNNGGTTYTLTDTNAAGTMWQSIWDTGGVDTIEFNGSLDSLINLQAATLQDEFGGGGFISGVEGIAGGYTIANGVVIENGTSGSGNDVLMGNEVANVLYANAGADEVFGEGGRDRIFGGGGRDDLFGGGGNDTIRGGNGNDEVVGGSGRDNIKGQAGNDDLKGNAGADNIDGGNGNDDINGGNGNDVIIGGKGSDDLIGGSGNDDIFGGSGSDELNGGRGKDELQGGKRGDVLSGGGGADDIFGGSGNDLIYGGNGNDDLTGGGGGDTFVFDAGAGSDVVMDFNTSADTLLINTTLSVDQSASDIVNNATVEGGNTLLEFADGTTIELVGTFGDNALISAIEIF